MLAAKKKPTAAPVRKAIRYPSGNMFPPLVSVHPETPKFPPPRRGRIKVGVITSIGFQPLNGPLPFIPSRQGRGKGCFRMDTS